MKVYSAKLDWQDYESIAQSMGVTLYDSRHLGERTRGKYAGKVGVSFLLRPVTDDYRSAKIDPYVKTGVRRIWAVSWAGHYVFMRALLERDPEAAIVTGTAKYDGLAGFDNWAYMTGAMNVGSMVSPQEYRDAQATDHVHWETEDDLRTLALEHLREIAANV
jgi:hypothetical protein